MRSNLQNETRVSYNRFWTPAGLAEVYITITSRDDATVEEALEEIKDAYVSQADDLNLDRNTIQFTRVYLSDTANQYQTLLKSDLYNVLQSGAVSVIEQKPLFGPVSIISYHVKDDTGSLRKYNVITDPESPFQSVLTNMNNYSLLWTANCTGHGSGSQMQTESLFSELSATLQKYRMSLRENMVRTWIYVRDIDNNYKGMVIARREMFTSIGLTNETRYIASTGIEGKAIETESLVTLDSLSIGNIKEEQIVRMEAPENLSSTIVYGVTFERGLRIRFGDRSHLHISGTASIDNKGNILYPEDIRGQTERTIDNVEALLREHGATLSDMRYIIIYMRNRKHFQFIQDILLSRFPADVPVVPVEGAVCRPGWLIEMEGVAIIEDSTDHKPFL